MNTAFVSMMIMFVPSPNLHTRARRDAVTAPEQCG